MLSPPFMDAIAVIVTIKLGNYASLPARIVSFNLTRYMRMRLLKNQVSIVLTPVPELLQ